MVTLAYENIFEIVDWKDITSFVLITFGITYAIEFGLALAGFHWDGIPPLIGQYIIFSALVIPLAFALVYGLSWLLGLGQPDWNLNSLRELMSGSGTDLSSMPSAPTLLAVLFFNSLIVGPTINGLFGFREEYGWRNYLLSKLIPLGKLMAYTILGVIWMCGLSTALGILLNEMTLRYQSSILAGSIHGVFNGQGYGIRQLLFPTLHPLPGGMTGFIGIGVFLVLGIWADRSTGKKEGQ